MPRTRIGTALEYSASELPANATFNLTTRSFAWIPTISQVGTYNVTFRVTDGTLSDTESVLITVTAVNQPRVIVINRAPVLAPVGNKTITTESSLTFTIHATDPEGNTLTYSASDLPSNATFDAETGSFAWTPTDSQVGTCTVTFRVTDGSLSDAESVLITVTLPNRAPVLAPIGNRSCTFRESPELYRECHGSG